MDKSKRMNWIYIAKGIAIMLVVVGHFSPSAAPECWNRLKQIIYLFHMPAFFFLSGFLLNINGTTVLGFINKKIKRLMYPFISIAAIFFLIKYIAGAIFVLDHPVTAKSLLYLFLDPVHSYMPLLWFIHTLFLIFIAYRLLLSTQINEVLLFMALTIISFQIEFSNPILNKLFYNIPFFSFGHIIKKNNLLDEISPLFQAVSSCLLFLVSSSIYFYLYSATPLRFLSAILGINTIVQFSIIINRQRDKTFSFKALLGVIGFFSMTIYLFHTLFESFVRILFYQILANIPVNFWIIAFFAVIAGILFPLILEKYLLRKSNFTRKYILGMRSVQDVT